MIRDELSQLKCEPRDLRKFGLLVGGVFALLAGWFFWRGKVVAPYLLVPAVPLLLLGAIWPRALKWVYLGWMWLALVLGMIVSTIILTVFFYTVVTPVGWLARAMGKDFLNRRLRPDAESYWIPRAQPTPRRREDYERQF